MMIRALSVTMLGVVLATAGCADGANSPRTSAAASAGESAGRESPGTPSRGASASGSAAANASGPNTSPNASTNTSASANTSAAPAVALRTLSEQLSEKGADFFSDNYLSNETSYLQIAPALVARAKTGGAYVGVGPEQNFTYLALLKPEIAFIVDIRRDNLVEQLLYKALFERASSRTEFLTLLIGRAYLKDEAPGPDANLDAILAHAEKAKPDVKVFERIHGELLAHLEARSGEALSASDKKVLARTHRAFFKAGLELRFELKENNGRRYPTLRELMLATDPSGARRSFLADEASFRTVQELERTDRVVPVVGDFAGPKALRAVGDEMRRRNLTLNAFYVSNVEQYLFEGGAWPKWVGNVAALPHDDTSLFIRCYLDQGKRHPLQMKGHRTASTLQRVDDFLAHDKARPYRSLWEVSSDPTNVTTLPEVRPASSSVP